MTNKNNWVRETWHCTTRTTALSCSWDWIAWYHSTTVSLSLSLSLYLQQNVKTSNAYSPTLGLYLPPSLSRNKTIGHKLWDFIQQILLDKTLSRNQQLPFVSVGGNTFKATKHCQCLNSWRFRHFSSCKERQQATQSQCCQETGRIAGRNNRTSQQLVGVLKGELKIANLHFQQ